VPPVGTAATRAWRGRIQPFPDGTEFAPVMAHLQSGDTVRVQSDGRLAHPPACRLQHTFFLPFSSAMTASHEVVLLSFDGLRHPRVYSITPEISRRAFPFHPHLRDDQGAIIDGKPLTALCTYLASDGALRRNEMELVHALDFTSMFLGKHLVWAATSLRTRISVLDGLRVLTSDPSVSRLLHRGQIFDGADAWFAAHYRRDAACKLLVDQVDEYLKRGYWDVLWPASWVGPVAPHFFTDLFRELRGDSECHCGSGEPYAKCHRPQDRGSLAARAS